MNKIFYLTIIAMVCHISCSNDDIDDGGRFSNKVLKQNSAVVDNGEHTYDIEWKDGGTFWGNYYNWRNHKDTISGKESMSYHTLSYEEEWFDLKVAEDYKKITIHVLPNKSASERSITVGVTQAATFSRFTLTQKE